MNACAGSVVQRPRAARRRSVTTPVAPGLLIRPVVPADRGALEEMHRRCSLDSRVERWRGAARHPAGLSDRCPERAPWTPLPGGAAAIRPVRPRRVRERRRGARGAWVVGVLVEDAWQRRGVGSGSSPAWSARSRTTSPCSRAPGCRCVPRCRSTDRDCWIIWRATVPCASEPMPTGCVGWCRSRYRQAEVSSH